MSCVVAGSDIPAGATVGPVSEDLPFGRTADDDTDVHHRLQVLYENGTFICTCMPRHTWTLHLRAARDRYEQNMEVYRHYDNHIYIRSIRTIRQGDQLLVWYHDSSAIENGIPFLTPENIKGTQEYTCAACEKSFRFPNSLKSHMRFHCPAIVNQSKTGDTFHVPVLKNPPAKCLLRGMETKEDAIVMDGHCLQCNSSDDISCARDVYDTEPRYTDGHCSEGKSYINPRHQPINYYQVTCAMRHSHVFCPYTFKARVSVSPIAGGFLQNHPFDVHRDVAHTLKCFQENNSCELTDFDEEPIDILHKSCIEVSSGKGHLCVYCGKFYSRKYGLKIHLRTHTGYKPLKCKICFRPFGDPSNLNKHVRLHSEGDTPYKCAYCGKVLVRKRDLVRHVKSRHPQCNMPDIKMEPNIVTQ